MSSLPPFCLSLSLSFPSTISTLLFFLYYHYYSYVEAALLNCYKFLTDQEFTQALIRLTKMTRGIGDPLVAAYARAYLCRVSPSSLCEDEFFMHCSM